MVSGYVARAIGPADWILAPGFAQAWTAEAAVATWAVVRAES
jgi:hypothetical protein